MKLKISGINKFTSLKLSGRRSKLIFATASAAAIAVVAFFVVSLVQESKDDQIKIGDTTITQDQISQYQKLIEEHLQSNPDESFGGDAAQVALDDLILNAAFKKEAKDRNMPLNVDDILAYTGDEIKDESQKQVFWGQFQKRDLMRRVRVENEAYKIKFADVLIAKKDVVMVTANFDTPLTSSASPAEAQRYYNQARDRLVKEILPLMESGAARQAIADASDVSTDFARDKGNDNNPDPYFEKIVTHAIYLKGLSGNDSFNDVDDTSYIKGNVGTLHDTDEKIAELKNVGDHTGVFAAKIGAYAIIRLEAKMGGDYSSWEEFLDNYKRKYVLSFGHVIKTAVSKKVKSGLNKALVSATSVGLQKAQAHPGNHSGCGAGHHVRVEIDAINVDTGTRIGGAKIRMHQPNNGGSGSCPEVNATRTTKGSGFESYGPNFPHCYNGLPTWTVTRDANPDRYDRASNFKQHNYAFEPGNWKNGFPNSWIPETANNTSIKLRLRYKEKPEPDPDIGANCKRLVVHIPNYSGGDRASFKVAIKDGNQNIGGDPPEGGWDYSFSNVAEGQNHVVHLFQDGKAKSGQLRYRIKVWTQAGFSDLAYDSGVQSENGCFKAQCSDLEIDERAGGAILDESGTAGNRTYAVKAGSPLTASIRATNRGNNTLNKVPAGYHLRAIRAHSGWPLDSPWISRDIEPNGSARAEFDFDAETSITSYQLVYYIGYAGYPPWNPYPVSPSVENPVGPRNMGQGFGFPEFCRVTINTYKEFDLRPSLGSIQLLPDEEEPSQVRLSGTVDNVAPDPATVNANVTRRVTKNGSTFQTWSGTYPLGSRTFNDTASISSHNIGDNYCATITVSPAYGWAGPNGNTINLDPPSRTAGPDCSEVSDRPYMRVYGNDIMAGGDFTGTSCRDDNGGVFGYQSGNSAKRGSAAQLAIIANNIVNGFNSAALRSSPMPVPRAPNGLTFANTPSLGSFGGSLCATNFFDDTQHPDGHADKETVSGPVTRSVNSLSRPQTKVNGNLTLTSSGSFTGKRAVYVDGDVFINGNIAYDQSSYASAIPNFSLIVKGNIYIAPTVTQLDGLFVAQPESNGAAGEIYTCATGIGNPVGRPQLYNVCGGAQHDNSSPDRQLVINGSFVAKYVYFMRTHGSLRDSSGSNEAQTKANAAELFRFSPEMYLSVPAFKETGGSGAGGYDYITTLPPIL